jgi:hypothetical protein
MRTSPGFTIALLPLLFAACGGSTNAPAPGAASSAATTTATTAAPAATQENHLSMKIDGVEWRADHDLFGAVHPPGYDRAILIAGSLGPKNAQEQMFNLNLFGTTGPGHYSIRHGQADAGVVQIGNLSPERYLAGSLLGYAFEVDVQTAQASPTRIEATFSGTLTANDSSVLKITDGRFRYSE